MRSSLADGFVGSVTKVAADQALTIVEIHARSADSDEFWS